MFERCLTYSTTSSTRAVGKSDNIGEGSWLTQQAYYFLAVMLGWGHLSICPDGRPARHNDQEKKRGVRVAVTGPELILFRNRMGACVTYPRSPYDVVASPPGEPSDDDITPPSTSQGEEEVQHGRPTRLPHGGGPVQPKLESISDSKSSPR
jgi:hypothetical protein